VTPPDDDREWLGPADRRPRPDVPRGIGLTVFAMRVFGCFFAVPVVIGASYLGNVFTVVTSQLEEEPFSPFYLTTLPSLGWLAIWVVYALMRTCFVVARIIETAHDPSRPPFPLPVIEIGRGFAAEIAVLVGACLAYTGGGSLVLAVFRWGMGHPDHLPSLLVFAMAHLAIGVTLMVRAHPTFKRTMDKLAANARMP
jgi:hypothetical protein